MATSMSKPSDGVDMTEALLAYFHALKPLYGLIDAARDPQTRPVLQSINARSDTLFSDHRAETLVDFAPYLVELPPDGATLPGLLAHYGDSWGLFVTSDASYEELLEHFRDLLWADTPDGTMLFRFYDPRVLNLFLPTCSFEQARRFFGPVNAFFAEALHPEGILGYTLTRAGLRQQHASLSQIVTAAGPRADRGRSQAGGGPNVPD